MQARERNNQQSQLTNNASKGERARRLHAKAVCRDPETMRSVCTQDTEHCTQHRCSCSTLVHLAKAVGSVCIPKCSAVRAQVVEAQQLHKAGAAVGHRTSSSCSGYCRHTELQQLQANLLNKTKYLLTHSLCPVTAQSDLLVRKH